MCSVFRAAVKKKYISYLNSLHVLAISPASLWGQQGLAFFFAAIPNIASLCHILHFQKMIHAARRVFCTQPITVTCVVMSVKCRLQSLVCTLSTQYRKSCFTLEGHFHCHFFACCSAKSNHIALFICIYLKSPCCIQDGGITSSVRSRLFSRIKWLGVFLLLDVCNDTVCRLPSAILSGYSIFRINSF